MSMEIFLEKVSCCEVIFFDFIKKPLKICLILFNFLGSITANKNWLVFKTLEIIEINFNNVTPGFFWQIHCFLIKTCQLRIIHKLPVLTDDNFFNYTLFSIINICCFFLKIINFLNHVLGSRINKKKSQLCYFLFIYKIFHEILLYCTQILNLFFISL